MDFVDFLAENARLEGLGRARMMPQLLIMPADDEGAPAEAEEQYLMFVCVVLDYELIH